MKNLQRVRHRARITMTPAMDDHPVISRILLARATAAAKAAPAKTTVLLLAHGPNDTEENRLWLKDLNAHAAYLKAHGHFRAVPVATRRDDADDATKDRALREIRALVEAGDRDGSVVVVPVLLSEGGIEEELKDDLKGLAYSFAKPLLPDPKVGDWVKAMFRAGG
jgi:sirohydrochlorin ferrochelatase